MAEYLKIVKQDLLDKQYIDLCIKGSDHVITAIKDVSNSTKILGLCKACYHGHLELLKKLIHLEDYNQLYFPYIMEEAIKGHHIDMIKYILEMSKSKYINNIIYLGVNDKICNRVNYTELLQFSFQWAYETGNADIIELLDKQWSHDQHDIIDNTRFSYKLVGALLGNHTELVYKIMPKNLTKLDITNGLYISYKNNNEELIKYFDKHLVDNIENTSENIQYALTGACQGGHIELVKKVLAFNPGVVIIKHTLEHLAFKFGPNCCEIFNILIKQANTVELKYVLYCASCSNNYNLVKLLLERGIKDFDSICMTKVENIDIIKLLKEYGSDPMKVSIVSRMKYLKDVISKKHQTWIINEMFGTDMYLNFILINK